MTSVDGQQARVEAAANQIDYGLGVGASVETLAKDALAAADVVMFSEEAVERAADKVWPDAFMDPDRRQDQEYARALVATVIAALKGDDK